MEKTVLFLAHGGESVGMGHVIRCCSLATAFRLAGWKVFFYSKLEIGQLYKRTVFFGISSSCTEGESCRGVFLWDRRRIEKGLRSN